MQRSEVLQELAALVTEEDVFVCSIGGLVDDWWNLRPGRADNTFSHVALGSHSSTGFGLAVALPHRRVIVLDTDGSVLMNTGILCTLGNERPANLTVIVFDNEMYESAGGQPTLTSGRTDLARMAEGAGCINCSTVSSTDAFRKEAESFLEDDEMGFLVAKIAPGGPPWRREERYPLDGVEDKYRFIRHIERMESISIHPGPPQKFLAPDADDRHGESP